jgi:hypothetical protein
MPSLADATYSGKFLSDSFYAFIDLLDCYKFYALNSASHLFPTTILKESELATESKSLIQSGKLEYELMPAN